MTAPLTLTPRELAAQKADAQAEERLRLHDFHQRPPNPLRAVRLLLLTHPPRHTGECPVCHHYGSDCHASQIAQAFGIHY